MILNILLIILSIVILILSYLLFRLFKSSRAKAVQLSELNEQLKTIIHSIGDGLIWTDTSGRIKGINPVAQMLTGWRPQEALGKRLDQVMSVVDCHTKEKNEDIISKVLSSKQTVTLEDNAMLISKDGKSFMIGDSAAPIVDARGDISGVVIVFRDITQEKNRENELIDSQNLFRKFMNSFPASVYIKDSQLRTTFANDYMLKNFLDDERPWKGLRADEIYPSNAGKQIYDDDKRALDEGHIIKEYDTEDKFGNRRWVQVHKFSIEKKNGEKYLGGFSIDITALKLTMGKLKEAESRAQYANRMKDVFLANINHEIRTPLNGITGILNLFEREGLNELQEDYLEMLDYSANRLKRLVEDILDFSKLNLDQIQLDKKPVDLDKIFQQIQNVHETITQGKGITLSCEYHSPVESRPLVDPLRLEQILHNLLSNSIKFTDTGSVDLYAEYIPSDAQKGILSVRVSDTGIGMNKVTQKRMFEYFYQGEQSYTRKFQGAGLGMAIVKKLVDLMDGEISCESTLGKGTIYRVELPVDIAVETAAGSISQPWCVENCCKDKTFLIVEDDRINRLILTRALSITGAKILEAVTGKEALEQIQKERPDLVFLDIQMPDMSGIDVMKSVRTLGDKGLQSTKIIVVSGYNQRNEVNSFFDAGADDFISKPIEREGLLKTVRKFIN